MGESEASGLRPRLRHRHPLSSLQPLLGPAVTLTGAPVGGTGLAGLASDSRLVEPGDLYLALPGTHTHGAAFAATALAQGAAAVLTDERGRALLDGDGLLNRVPVAVVADPRAVMAGLAAELYGRPAESLRMLGVTGTNGKTTTSYLIDAGLRAAGRHAGLIGTLGFTFDGSPLRGARTTVTTPESPELQGLLAAMGERGATAVAMEVSSHALTVGRVDGIRFDVAGFTNFGRDHLDFHGTEEAYFAAKADLFTAARTLRAVINLDDPRGPTLVAQARREGLEVTTTGLGGGPNGSADWEPVRVRTGPDASRVQVRTPAGELEFALGLPGPYNVHNALTALAMLSELGSLRPELDLDLAAAAAGFGTVAVPGRMQRVPLGSDGPQVYVDFAHTPQAVGSALAALADRSSGGRLICVLGCGGDRDPAKRGPMGATAARGVDPGRARPGSGSTSPGVVVITDDNPRTEDPATIRAAALAGAREAIGTDGSAVTLIDGGERRAALRIALALAAESADPRHQVIAVLGKGHEHGQEIGGETLAFDDVEVVGRLWSELTGGTL